MCRSGRLQGTHSLGVCVYRTMSLVPDSIPSGGFRGGPCLRLRCPTLLQDVRHTQPQTGAGHAQGQHHELHKGERFGQRGEVRGSQRGTGQGTEKGFWGGGSYGGSRCSAIMCCLTWGSGRMFLLHVWRPHTACGLLRWRMTLGDHACVKDVSVAHVRSSDLSFPTRKSLSLLSNTGRASGVGVQDVLHQWSSMPSCRTDHTLRRTPPQMHKANDTVPRTTTRCTHERQVTTAEGMRHPPISLSLSVFTGPLPILQPPCSLEHP